VLRNNPVAITLARWARAFSAPAGVRELTGFAQPHWQALHPEPAGVPIYHSALHSLNVSMVMERLSCEYFPGHEDYLGKVAGLHDIDPGRDPGTPSRVPATLDWMRTNAADLKRRLLWSDQQFEAAKVIIMRTEYPLDSLSRKGSYLGTYKDRSPREIYRMMLAALPANQRAFALSAGAILSEYADKASWYLEEPRTARAAVQGLANEINAAGGHADLKSLNTHLFLSQLGGKDSFAFDDQLAGELELKGLRLPLMHEVLTRLSVKQRLNFKENIAQFLDLQEQWDSVGWEGGAKWDS
jgi:hypothetical protein